MTRLLLLAVAVIVLASGCLSARYPQSTPPAAKTSGPDSAPVPGGRGNPPFYEVFGQRYHVMADAHGYNERGVASWYGGKFHGRSTSSGERYDMHGMTAAHKSLPLPTWVRVTNLRNGSQVIVKVNDRGPFVKNRLIDLSYAAAQQLDMISAGTTLVQVEVIDALSGAERQVSANVSHSRPTVERPRGSSPGAGMQSSADPAASQDASSGDDVMTGAAGAHDDAVNPALASGIPPVSGNGPDTSSTAAAGATVLYGHTDDSGNASSGSPIAAPPPPGPGTEARIFVQVGAFGDVTNAQRMRSTLYNADIANVRLAGGEHLGLSVYRVQIGPIAGVTEYDLLVGQLESLGIIETHLITE